jgi:hypothetical protein
MVTTAELVEVLVRPFLTTFTVTAHFQICLLAVYLASTVLPVKPVCRTPSLYHAYEIVVRAPEIVALLTEHVRLSAVTGKFGVMFTAGTLEPALDDVLADTVSTLGESPWL